MHLDRLTSYNKLLQSGLVAIFYHPDPTISRKIVSACIEGGAEFVEIVNRGDQALTVFSDLSQWIRKENLPVVLGAGTIMEASTAAVFVAHGADFIVAPTLNAEIAHFCNRRKIPYVPGCFTPTEINFAEELGCEIVKIFPSSTLGPGFLRDLLAPMQWSRIMPTGGGVDATKECITSWIQAGAACFGMGPKLIRKDWVDKGDFNSIKLAVRDVLSWISEARK
jgi:2-dehydro-3-deoxyphosphogluconate aldolase / (4S)-4-hydroxy-2-oxoglutarate aldolase